MLIEGRAGSRGCMVGGAAWPPVCVGGGGMMKMTRSFLPHKGWIRGHSWIVDIRKYSGEVKNTVTGGRA